MDIRKIVFDGLLTEVEKPGRYIGGEWNSTKKTFEDTACQIAFCFPDVYEVGMSHLGLQILYGLVNETTPYLMERSFMPWPDMYKKMQERGIPLYSLESFKSLSDFPIVGFTLQYEMSYTNILAMLGLANVPLTSNERMNGAHPLVIAGGPCSVNPEPISSFIDLFLIGDGEQALPEILKITTNYLVKGKIENRKELLLKLSELNGVYIPAFYKEEYDSEGKYLGTFNIHDRNIKVKKTFVADLDNAYFPTKLVIPFVDAIHDRMMLEVLRGCTHGCRFCQAGNYYRPVREKSVSKLLETADKLVVGSGYDDISLTSLSTADYTGVKELVSKLLAKYEKGKISISLPSLRVDTFSVELAKEIQKVRKTGFTFAPEAGTQRMRDIINKGVSEEDLMASVEGAFQAGWQRLKLYFMIGLPEETDEDVIGIIELGKKVLDLGRKISGGKNIIVTVSVASFVPKPFTAFQWFGQNTKDELIRKQYLLKEAVREIGKGLKLSYHYSALSVLEGMFARGDRRLGNVLQSLYNKGAMFDSWDDWFKLEMWNEALEENAISKEAYSEHFFAETEPMYWDHIDIGVKKLYLWNEYQKSKSLEITRDCRLGCTACGVCNDEIRMDIKGEYHG
ncbi:MAG: radical SAM protein [Fusobacteria bacterium]|nr:MAG: radical SAM protein [Fusobacteriota bacterium]KAF0230039.1 MAG: radical SAM [Fusobacteriota bacterium]